MNPPTRQSGLSCVTSNRIWRPDSLTLVGLLNVVADSERSVLVGKSLPYSVTSTSPSVFSSGINFWTVIVFPLVPISNGPVAAVGLIVVESSMSKYDVPSSCW